MAGNWTIDDLKRKGYDVKQVGANYIASKNTPIVHTVTNDSSTVKIQTDQQFHVKLNVTPCPKPRMTRSDKWNKRPVVMRYRDFCDALRAEAERCGFELPNSGFWVKFYLPIPKKYLNKDYQWKPHQQKPDSDNLVKAVFDALKKEDKDIWDFRVSKFYSSEPCIIIERIS